MYMYMHIWMYSCEHIHCGTRSYKKRRLQKKSGIHRGAACVPNYSRQSLALTRYHKHALLSRLARKARKQLAPKSRVKLSKHFWLGMRSIACSRSVFCRVAQEPCRRDGCAGSADEAPFWERLARRNSAHEAPFWERFARMHSAYEAPFWERFARMHRCRYAASPQERDFGFVCLPLRRLSARTAICSFFLGMPAVTPPFCGNKTLPFF